jgi:hypothetical protein
MKIFRENLWPFSLGVVLCCGWKRIHTKIHYQKLRLRVDSPSLHNTIQHTGNDTTILPLVHSTAENHTCLEFTASFSLAQERSSAGSH